MASEALKLCLKWLKSGDLTEAELRLRLGKKEISGGDADDAILFLKSKKWLSDERIVERQVEVGKARLQGRLKIEHELQKRGVPDEMVSSAVEEISDGDETEAARTLLRLRLKETDPPQKAARMLASRGFSEEVVQRVLEERYPDLF